MRLHQGKSDLSAVNLGHPLNDGQSQPTARNGDSICTVKRFAKMPELTGGHSWSIVSHTQLYGAARLCQDNPHL